MTIAQAFNEIAIAQGGTASTSGTIAGAIDALNDALAGSDQQSAQTIEDAVRLLGQNIGSGGGGGSSIGEISSVLGITYGGIAAMVPLSADANLESVMVEIPIVTASAEAPLTCAIPTGSFFAISKSAVELGNCAVMTQVGQAPQPMTPVATVQYQALGAMSESDYYVYEAETSAMYLIVPLG